MIRGILFDLGDTLIDFGQVDIDHLFAQGAQLAYDYLRGLNQPLPDFSVFHRRQLRAIRFRWFISRLTGREFNSIEVLGRISQKMGQKLTCKQTEELAWLWYEPLSKCAKVEDGIIDVLSGFTSRGLKLAIVSNTFVPGVVLDRHLSQLGLLEYFPVRVYSCDVGYRKPDRRIFYICLDKINLSPQEAMFVGDQIKVDIAGARRVGMISVLKDPTGKKRHWRIRPDYRITSLKQLPEIVNRQNFS